VKLSDAVVEIDENIVPGWRTWIVIYTRRHRVENKGPVCSLRRKAKHSDES